MSRSANESATRSLLRSGDTCGARTAVIPRPGEPWLFSVEPDTAQITWRADRTRGIEPGVQLIDGLRAGSVQHVEIGALGTTVRVETPPQLDGPELCRVATINDLHIGATSFGFFGTMKEPAARVPHAVRCVESAIRDALAWGARLLVVKGDLTHKGRESEWRTIGELLASQPVPVAVVPGNHDVKPYRHLDPQPALAAHGLHLVHGMEVIDLPGVRVVLADTTVPDFDRGHIAHVAADIVRVAARAAGGVLVALHHHPQRYRFPTFLPTGIPGPEAAAFLSDLAAANPSTLVTTGHTHRHRRHERFGLTVCEVGSTKDYPGTWTGYVVHASGIRQVVRRVSDPTCLPWLDYTGRAALGLWRRWSPGRLDDRCFAVRWPASTGDRRARAARGRRQPGRSAPSTT